MKVRLAGEDTRNAIEEYLNRLMRGTVAVATIRAYDEDKAIRAYDEDKAGGSCCIEADITIVEEDEE